MSLRNRLHKASEDSVLFKHVHQVMSRRFFFHSHSGEKSLDILCLSIVFSSTLLLFRRFLLLVSRSLVKDLP